MLTLAFGLALLTATTPPVAFDDQKKAAVTVERLSSTVAAIVGVCPDGLMADELAECQHNVGKGAAGFTGKTVYLNLGGGQEQFLTFADKSGDRAKLVWSPIIDLGNGLAVTLEKPLKLSSTGTVVVARKPFEGVSDVGLEASDLQRAVKTGQVGIELIGRFGKPWQLNGKEPVRGVVFEWTAARFFHTRSGKVLVEVNR